MSANENEGIKYNDLKKYASEYNFTVGTFTTNFGHYRQNAVLWVGIGKPISRQSHLVLATWDVSYSIGRDENGKNKWARALDQAKTYIDGHFAPDLAEVEATEVQRRKERRKKQRQERRAELAGSLTRTSEQLSRLIPTTLRAVRERLPSAVLDSFGISAEEKEELLDDTSIVALYSTPAGQGYSGDEQILVKQFTTQNGLGWYRISASHTEKPIIQLKA